MMYNVGSLGLPKLPQADRSCDQVTLKENAPHSELEKAKDTAKEQGGIIRHEYTLIKGFTVEFPADKVHAFQSNEHVHVEADEQVKTQ
ncbi:MAG: hypothetical protein M1817_003221 [Caeruleum heppii]|nr:MAG: hypothetical protein M1817_003221 [Caeruleum heppii]